MLNVGSQTVPSLRRGGTDGESKRGAASERTPLSSATTNPRRGWLKRGELCQDEQSPMQKTGEPPQGPEGRRPEERWAPTRGLVFRYLTRYFFDTGRLLKLSEVDDGRAGLRLLHVGGRFWVLLF